MENLPRGGDVVYAHMDVYSFAKAQGYVEKTFSN